MNGLTAKQVKARFMAGMAVAVGVGIVALMVLPGMQNRGQVQEAIPAVNMVIYVLLALLVLGPMVAGMMMDWRNRPRLGGFLAIFNVGKMISFGVNSTIWSFKCTVLAYRGIVWALRQENNG